jgi:homocitrate synthase
LREGDQFVTAFFGTAQKIEIAKALDDIGVEYVRLLISKMGLSKLLTQLWFTDSLPDRVDVASCFGIVKSRLRGHMQTEFEAQGRSGSHFMDLFLTMGQILTHIRCHMDDARIAVQTGVDGV